MIISRDLAFVVFRPWKTASQTTIARLNRFNQSPYSGFFYFNKYLNRVVHQHLTCVEFVCLPESKSPSYKASFVRNPYDRVYSGFLQVQRDLQHQPDAQFPEPWVRELVLQQLAENRASLDRAEYDFDRWVAQLREDQVFEIGRNSNLPLHPAHYWTHIAGEQFVDFIGRVESFEQDFVELLGRLRIQEEVDRKSFNVSPITDDDVGEERYRHISKMNARSIERINSLFSSDFDAFGYERM